MTGKILNNNDSPGFLILIIPIAAITILLFKFWPIILGVMFLIIGLRIWQKYQWIKWSEQVNPFFNQLIQENQGCLTPIDLSLKANLTANAAKRFLEKKAEEFGAQRQDYQEKGPVYYFLTASALGQIFDNSDPEEEDSEDITPATSLQVSNTLPIVKEQPSESSAKNIAQLVDIEEDRPQTPPEIVTAEASSSIAAASTTTNEQSLALIQNELAKRLDINTSTVGRRKSDPDFAEWTQSKDPDGIAWKYIPKTKMFVPVDLDK
jgi:hypothetical protein